MDIWGATLLRAAVASQHQHSRTSDRDVRRRYIKRRGIDALHPRRAVQEIPTFGLKKVSSRPRAGLAPLMRSRNVLQRPDLVVVHVV